MSGDLARISETAYESKLLLKDNLALDVGCENRGNLNLVHKIQANLSGVIYAKVFHLHNENYNLIVVSSEFAGKPMKVQHRLVQKVHFSCVNSKYIKTTTGMNFMTSSEPDR